MGPSTLIDGDIGEHSLWLWSYLLQWGRRLSSTETPCDCEPMKTARVASMGPSTLIDGDQARRPHLHLQQLASMGPSTLIDGDDAAQARAGDRLSASMGPSTLIDG